MICVEVGSASKADVEVSHPESANAPALTHDFSSEGSSIELCFAEWLANVC